jgi:hypothetical protein
VVSSSESTKKLMKNVLSWVAKNSQSPRVAQLFGADCSAFNFFAGTTYSNVTDPSQLTTQNFDVVCFGNFNTTPAGLNEFKLAVRAFVQSGGGLSAGANSIAWAQNNAADFLTSFPFNVLLREFGVLLLNGFYTRTQVKVATVHPNAPDVKAFLEGSVLPVLKGQAANYSDLTVIANHRTVIQGLDSVQFEAVCGWDLYNRLVDAFAASSFNSENGNAPACNAEPYKSSWDLLYDLSLLAPAEVARALPPAINGYPGVASTDVVTKTFEVPLDKDAWFHTGLYANPGETFEVRFTDGLWQENPFEAVQLRLNTNDNIVGRPMACDRNPIMSQSYTLDRAKYSHYGGGFIVLLVVRKTEGKVARITVTARQGNYFNENLNTPAQAAALLRNNAPSIVIECDLLTFIGRGRTNYLVYGVNAKLACDYINLVMKDFELFGFDIRPFTKQMVHADVRISAGFMHSGNPIQMM